MSGTEMQRREAAPLEPVPAEIIEVSSEPVVLPRPPEQASAAELVQRGLSLLQGVLRLGLLILEERQSAREVSPARTLNVRTATTEDAPSVARPGGGGHRRRHRSGRG
ncbi:MAG TPA: hypothetical protein ENN14_00240 [Chloroflexi bacterium]|nr:hypothetical protein [Chloroflexota bacterium]